LPVLYDEAGQPLLSADFFRHVAQLVAQHGSDVWFASSAEALTQGFELPPQWQGKTLVKSQDTLDVWLDSGCSHRAVLHQHPELAWPADVYFEGSDQHRGWFQSSFWTALVADGALPYRHLITHGFVVGEDKRKISKSDGKPQTADDYVGRLGADIVRWWICSEDYRNDVPLSEGILDQMAQGYRCIRNTLRFLLGNLHDFDATQAVPTTQLLPLDQWALYETALLARNVTAAMDAFEFHKATQQLGYFCSVTLSATYHDSLKDRLYTTSPQGHARRSAQSVLHTVLHTLLGLLAPVLVFTADEAFGHTPQAAQQAQQSPGHAPSVHLQPWPVAIEGLCSDAQLQTTHAAVAELLSLKGPVNEALEAMRQAKTLGQSLDAQLHICLGAQHPLAGPLQQHAQHLAELFIVSAVHVELVDAQADARPQVRATKASGLRCPRSWRWVPQLAQHPHFGPVSPRCHQALVAKYPDLT
jgi:isoleucyl-tRNA synthetase